MRPTPPLGSGLAALLPLLGLILVMATTRLSRFPTLIGQGANLLLLLVAMVVVFVASLVLAQRIGAAAAGSRQPPLVLSWPVLFAVGLLMRLPLVPAPPMLSDDVHRFVWDGRVAAHGENPYRYAPVDTALASLRDDDWRRINNPSLPTGAL